MQFVRAHRRTFRKHLIQERHRPGAIRLNGKDESHAAAVRGERHRSRAWTDHSREKGITPAPGPITPGKREIALAPGRIAHGDVVDSDILRV